MEGKFTQSMFFTNLNFLFQGQERLNHYFYFSPTASLHWSSLFLRCLRTRFSPFRCQFKVCFCTIHILEKDTSSYSKCKKFWVLNNYWNICCCMQIAYSFNLWRLQFYHWVCVIFIGDFHFLYCFYCYLFSAHQTVLGPLFILFIDCFFFSLISLVSDF